MGAADIRTPLRTVIGAAGVAPIAAAASAQPRVGDLASASLEELMNIPTATRSAEGAATAPARVTVVTAGQIGRRGYRSLADLLKDLPEFKVDTAGDQDYPTELTVDGARGSSRVIVRSTASASRRRPTSRCRFSPTIRSTPRGKSKWCSDRRRRSTARTLFQP